jgi:hypothetical protein
VGVSEVVAFPEVLAEVVPAAAVLAQFLPVVRRPQIAKA